MKIQQISSPTRGNVVYRDVSCICTAPKQCECYNPKTMSISYPTNIPDDDTKENESEGHPLDVFGESLKGVYCVVLYDKKPFPGVIVDVDDGEVEVSVMHSVGRNRFFWPMMEDVVWYEKQQFVKVINPPEKVTERLFQIQKNDWKDIQDLFDQ